MNKWLIIMLGVSITAAGHAQDSSITQTGQRQQYSSEYSEERSDPYGYGYERKARPSPHSEYSNKEPQQPRQESQQAHLSEQEEKFATWLSPIHKRVFTQVFTPSMRASAMKLASFRFYDMDGPAGSISPDQAVEILMSKFRHQAGKGKSSNGRRGCINPNQTPYKRYGGSSTYDEPRSSSRKPRVSPYGD